MYGAGFSMFKKSLLLLIAIFTIYLIIDQTILSKEEMPEVRFELADKTIPYKISNYSWGKVLDKEKRTNKETYMAVKNEIGTTAFKGETVQIHFSELPENVEIIERSASKKMYIYDQYIKNFGIYSFQIGPNKGERIFEVKGIWKGNNYFTYLIKLKIT